MVASPPYILDCDALVHIQQMDDSGRIYQEIVAMVGGGDVKSVAQAIDEMRRFPEPYEIFNPLRRQMLVNTYDPDIFRRAGEIITQYERLIDQGGTKNPDPADPWLIAAAEVLGGTVVTDERGNSLAKIPGICNEIEGVECINGPEFLADVGII